MRLFPPHRQRSRGGRAQPRAGRREGDALGGQSWTSRSVAFPGAGTSNSSSPIIPLLGGPRSELPRAALASQTQSPGRKDRGSPNTSTKSRLWKASQILLAPKKSRVRSCSPSGLETEPGERTFPAKPTSAAGEEQRGLPSEELDTSAIVQRDNFSLVLLLQGLQGAEQHRLV